MKYFRPVLFAFFVGFLFSAQPLFSQNPKVIVYGPAFLCPGQCGDYSAEITDLPQPGQYQLDYQWSNGSTTQTIVICQPGIYSVTVSVWGIQSGFSSHPLGEIKISQSTSNALFISSDNFTPCNDSISGSSPGCEKVCPNTTFTYFTYNIDGVQTPSNWEVFGAQNYTTNQDGTVTVTWGSPGSGNLSAFSQDSFCQSSTEKCITIIETPVAKISSKPALNNGKITVCKGQTVYFENQSSGADIFEWNFGNGFLSSEPSPQVSFPNPGVFKAQLIARSACLCSDTTNVEIYVLDIDSPTLDCVGTVCPGETVTYTATGSCPGYSWQVSPNGAVISGGATGSASITIDWQNGPVGTLNLTGVACSGAVCPFPTVVEIPVISNNAEIAGRERVCPGSEEVYKIENYGGTNFQWTLSGGGKITDGQGTSQVSVEWAGFPSAANYWLSVVYDNCYLGCGGKDSISVKVLSPFQISGPVEFCADGVADFSAKKTYDNGPVVCKWKTTNSSNSTVWNYASAASTAPVPFLEGAGFYRIFATPTNLNETCTDVAEWSVQVRPRPAKPTGITGNQTICPGQPITYEATGLAGNPPILWSWKNGTAPLANLNGNPLNLTWGNASPRWLAAQVLSTDGLGCKSDSVMINVSEIANFSIFGQPATCRGKVLKYTAPNLQSVDYQWEIVPNDAGTFAAGFGTNEVEIFWNKPGNHTLRVSICGKMATKNVTVFALPEPIVQHPAGLCPNDLGAVKTSQNFSSYFWNDDLNNTIGSAANQNLPAGTYSVNVVDANGCAGTSEFTIQEFPEPNLTVSTPDPTGFCNNDRFVTMSALVTSDADYIYDWKKDGASLGVNSPVYSTNQYGFYSVAVQNQFGCTAEAGPIEVFEYCGAGGVCHNPSHGPKCQPGDVDMQIDPTAECDSFVFKNISGNLYQPGSATWRFGESGANFLGEKMGEEVSFRFPNAGWYIVVLYATLTNGLTCVDLDSVKVKVKSGFDIDAACPGAPTVFKDISTAMPGENIASWSWDFGDPASGASNFSASPNPNHAYFLPGNYAAVLTVTSNFGCTSTMQKTVEVPDFPIVTFTPPSENCEKNALEFQSNPTATDLTATVWDFGEPSSAAANSAVVTPAFHTFSTSGNYTVSLTATNVFGCTATSNQIVLVEKNNLSGTVNIAPASICEGAISTLTAPVAQKYAWSDGSISQKIMTGKEGVYSVTISDSKGCTFSPPPAKLEVIPSPDATIKAILKNENGQIVGTAYSNLSVCEGEDVFLAAAGSGNLSYKWSSGGSSVVQEFSEARGNLLPQGSYVFTVTVTDNISGCTSITEPFSVAVNPKPANLTIFPITFPPCGGSNVTFNLMGGINSALQFTWNTGEIGPSLTTKEPGIYFLRATNQFGCATESNRETVFSGPNVAAIPSGCHTRCRPDTLCFPTLPNVNSWQWFFNGSAMPGATSPNLIATQSGSYTLNMTDWNGCSATSPPLDVDLYDGFGTILGQVWSDLNNNGAIDAADTLVSGIDILLLQSGSNVGGTKSDAAGGFSFSNILSTGYVLQIDAATLPVGWTTVIGSQNLNLSGCDDLENGDLLIKPACLSTTQTVDLQACAGSFAVFNSTQIPAGGSQIFNFTNAAGCDSTINVNVASVSVLTSNLNLSACPGGFATFQSTQIPAGGSQNFTLISSAGCDSIVSVNVSTLPVLTGNLDLSACPGGFATFQNTQIPAGGSQNFTLKSVVTGCDSIVSVNVSTLPILSGSLNLTACPGEFAVFQNTQIPAGTSQNFTLKSVVTGCDSIVSVQVSTLPVLSGSLNLTACPGDFAVFQNTQIPAGSSQNFTLISSNGCDSIVSVTVSTLPVFSSNLTLKTCTGSFSIYENVQIPAGATEVFTLVSQGGCDSTVTVFAEEIPLQFVDNQVNVCPSTTYLFAGENIPAGETKTFKFIGSEGCDSTVTVSVAAFPDLEFEIFTKKSCTNLPTGEVAAGQILGGKPPFQFSLDGQNFQPDSVFEKLSAGNFSVQILDGNDCLFKKDTFLDARPPLEVFLENAVLPCDSSGVLLSPQIFGDTSGLQILWSSGAKTIDYQAFEPGKLMLQVQNDCEILQREAEIMWEDSTGISSFIFVPNVFAPGSAGFSNDIFRAFPAAGLTILEYELKVFDRWGEMIYISNRPEDGWPGPFRQGEMQPAVFVWLLEMKVATCGRVFVVKKQGDVAVVR